MCSHQWLGIFSSCHGDPLLLSPQPPQFSLIDEASEVEVLQLLVQCCDNFTQRFLCFLREQSRWQVSNDVDAIGDVLAPQWTCVWFKEPIALSGTMTTATQQHQPMGFKQTSQPDESHRRPTPTIPGHCNKNLGQHSHPQSLTASS